MLFLNHATEYFRKIRNAEAVNLKNERGKQLLSFARSFNNTKRKSVFDNSKSLHFSANQEMCSREWVLKFSARLLMVSRLILDILPETICNCIFIVSKMNQRSLQFSHNRNIITLRNRSRIKGQFQRNIGKTSS